MDKSIKILEHKAKGLVGKQVRIKCRRLPSQTMPGVNFSSYAFDAKLEGVEHRRLTIRKQTGMLYSISLKDEYMLVEDVFQIPKREEDALGS